ncbi:MAG: TonB C-terminal domain-containing protein [Desulfobacterales bacterium]|nr:TonB C-terminal domain-containing protein [Desulfobacterales bacterium]
MTLKMTVKNNHKTSHTKDSASLARLYGGGNENRLVMMAFTASLICHCIIFSLFIYVQTHKPKQRSAPIVMNVKLVSLPEYTGPSKQVSKPSVSKEKKATSGKKKVSKKAVTIKKKPASKPSVAPKTVKKKVSLKKKTYKSEKVKENTLQKLEKKIEATTSDRIAKAIDEIKAKVDKTKDRTPPSESETPIPESKQLGGDGEAAGGKLAEIVDIYRVEVAYKIQQNWAFPEQLADGRSDLQTLLVFKIMPNGEIKDLFFTDRSGNNHFDESAFRAVMKSDPVDPHPGSVSTPYVQMGLRFTPEGIQ